MFTRLDMTLLVKPTLPLVNSTETVKVPSPKMSVILLILSLSLATPLTTDPTYDS